MLADHDISSQVTVTHAVTVVMAVFGSLAIYNVIELLVIIFTTFKQRRGLYFWSFISATIGIFFYTMAFLLHDFYNAHVNLATRYVFVTIAIIAWPAFVTGQSLILYSRLNLVLRNQKVLRGVLIMIIVDAIVCHLSITVVAYGTNSANPKPWIIPYSILEKPVITIFLLQEQIISGLYIYSSYALLKPAGAIKERERRKIMTQLIWVNAVIFVLDVIVASIEYAGEYEIQTMFKPAAYSVKLKLEFKILNDLLEMTRANPRRPQQSGDSSYPASTKRNEATSYSAASANKSRIEHTSSHNSIFMAPLGNSTQDRHSQRKEDFDVEVQYDFGVTYEIPKAFTNRS